MARVAGWLSRLCEVIMTHRVHAPQAWKSARRGSDGKVAP